MEAVAAAVVVVVAVDDEAAAKAPGRHVVVAVAAVEEAMVGHNSLPACDAEAHTAYVASSGEVPEPQRAWRAAALGVRSVVVASEEVAVLASSKELNTTTEFIATPLATERKESLPRKM